jgi:predicted GIY-YIG superfamily endonuclease
MSVYILHFSSKIGHARHYVGWANDVAGRIKHHKSGSGARLTQVAVERGVQMVLARTFDGADKSFERRLKRTNNTAKYCPICAGEKCRAYHPRSNNT